MTDIHALYRFYNATGQLLYVGITANPSARFKAHQSDKHWSIDICGITLEYYKSRGELLEAEARAIKIERPRHNVIHNHSRPKQSSPPPGFRCISCHRLISSPSSHFITETLKVVCNDCAYNSSSRDIHANEYTYCNVKWHDLWDHELIQSPHERATRFYLSAITRLCDAEPEEYEFYKDGAARAMTRWCVQAGVT